MTELLKKEIYELFRQSLPCVIREEEAVYGIVGNKENIIIEKRNAEDKLIGVSVIHKNTILLLCVAPEYRRQGIGTWLLEESEKVIREAGYDEITVGVGDDYITPHNNIIKNPIPILMMKVLPDVVFEFRFKLSNIKIGEITITAEDKKHLFTKILSVLGVGAKTNVGYGNLIEYKE